MVQHIIEYINARNPAEYFGHIRLEEVMRELDTLDTRDFLPSARADLMRVRIDLKFAQLRGHSHDTEPALQLVLNSVVNVLGQYAGEGSRAVSREFNYLTSSDLREIVERDYRELSLILFPGGAWKSTVVLAGSILEAILVDQLTTDAVRLSRSIAAAAAVNSARLPNEAKVKGSAPEDWRLVDLIDVAAEMHIIPQHRAASVDQTLRDFRNYIHPMKELRRQHPCTEAEALSAKGALDAVCNHLEATP